MNKYKNFCRICLQENLEQYRDIFSNFEFSSNNEIAINILIEECSSVIIKSDDDFSHIICLNCFEILKIAYNFRLLCIKTNFTLQANKDVYLNNTNSKTSVDTKLKDSISKVKTKLHKKRVKKEHTTVEYNKKGVCEICGKSFVNDRNLKVHTRIHTGCRPYSCKICGVTKITECDLRSHMKTHSNEHQYSCYICGKQFKWLSNQLRHMRMHEGVRDHKCSVCNKSFLDTSALKRHMYIHTGEKPFVCDICNRAFQRRGRLNHHRKIVHNKSLT